MTFTTLLRDPKSVLEAVERSDVVLRRRDGPALRLSREDRGRRADEGMALLSSFMGDVLRVAAVRSLLPSVLDREMPWTRFLPDDARKTFVDEFISCSEASTAVGDLAPLAALVHEWKATAAIYADPELATELQRSLPGDGLPVDRP